MNIDRTCLEDLPNELFYFIFLHLTPHDLLSAFENLNQRFQLMLAEQPLILPSNRWMRSKLYHDYLTKILPKYASQVVYLHLSERYCPGAVESFISEVSLDNALWPALKAVTIEDVSCEAFETLLDDCTSLFQIQSFTLISRSNQYYADEYKKYEDFELLLLILDSLTELRSLHLQNWKHPPDYDSEELNQRLSDMQIHQNLQQLFISDCSGQLLAELLSNGYLPQLRRLQIRLIHHGHIEPTIETLDDVLPLQQAFAPELRYVKVELLSNITWVLTFFEELQRHSQLDYFHLFGKLQLANSKDLPRLADLQRWLTLSSSNVFRFRMKFDIAPSMPALRSLEEEVFDEYKQATSKKYAARSGTIEILYPQKCFFQTDTDGMNKTTSSSSDDDDDSVDEPAEMDTDDDDDSYSSSGSENCQRCEPLDENAQELELEEDDYVNTNLFEELQEISCWHHLRKITVKFNRFPDEDHVIGHRLTRLAHVIQCSPQLREIHIEHNLDYARALAFDVPCGLLFTSKLEIFQYTTVDCNSSFVDIARLVLILFNHSTSPPRLKDLFLKIDKDPNTWLSTDHLVRWMKKLIKRFPLLVHFTLCCPPSRAFENSSYDLSYYFSECCALLSASRRFQMNALSYRCQSHLLEIWL
ncbi:unnamed protein product [Adineta ricciae]|uniref:F-box domain-containing protein n=1 Tax=Adineta ricciae TaxID=249248 RepID=A0A815QY09_ADIRI|nr:unnamed protein product [Adineta ricciae]CAF1469260.1 unnamed protein product [Adineta ricciae]